MGKYLQDTAGQYPAPSLSHHGRGKETGVTEKEGRGKQENTNLKSGVIGP